MSVLRMDWRPAVVAVAVAAALIAVGTLPTLRDSAVADTGTSVTVRVGADDTLWSIASSHRLPGEPTARAVERIKQANGLRTASLPIGARVKVPVPCATDAAVADLGSGARTP